MRHSLFRLIASAIIFATAALFGLFLPVDGRAQAPFTAVADTYTLHVGMHLDVTENDEMNGYNPYHTLVDPPSHGTINGTTTGWFYVADYAYDGSDSLTYKLCLGEICSNTVTVDIDVVNVPPYPSGDFYIVRAGTATCNEVRENDYETEGDPWHVNAVTTPTYGQLTGGTQNGCRFFYHAPQYETYDTYSYEACDSTGVCSDPVSVHVYVVASTIPMNNGTCPLPRKSKADPPPPPNTVGQPVNVTTGNMWLSQSDYGLPGVGENLDVTRTYNSLYQTSGLFGTGWSTKYDESIQTFGSTYSDLMIRLNMPDGKAVMFARGSTNDPFVNVTSGMRGSIVRSTDSTYTLTFKDGRVHKFDSNGKLLWQKDHNGNQTTLNYTSGVLTGVTDPFNRTLTISVNGSGNVTAISDSTGTVAEYEYYPSTSRLKTVTYPDGSEYNFEYTTVGSTYYLSTVKDALDNVLETHAYDSSGRATTSEKDGGVEEYTLDYTNMASGQTVVTDGLNRVTTYHYDKSRGPHVITSIAGACGCGSGGTETTSYQYDGRANIVKKTDALLNETVYTYDYSSNSNLTSMTDVLGTQTFTYNGLGQVLTATDRMGGVTTNTYTPAGNLLTTEDALDNTTTLMYSSLGQLQTVTDARNHTTTLGYDTQGRLTQITDANSKNTIFGYDARARLTSMTNALSQTTSFEYDLNNRLNKVIYPDTNFATMAYDLAGRPITATDQLNHSTTYAYDAAYRLTSVTDALNHATTFGYDLMSNLTSQTDALGNITTFEYDDFDRLKKVIYPAPSASATPLQEAFTYDKLGKIKTHVDTGGRTTSYDYDTASRLIKITDPYTQLTQFEYNARSQMTKVKDALNQEYVFTYDALSRVLTQTRNGTTTTFTYDAVGNRATREDYIGNDTTYTYDVLDRLTNIAYSGSSEYATYGYDDLSRLTSAVNQNGTVSFTYDNRGRQKTETDVYGQVIENVYDAADRRTGLKLNSNTHTTFAYDNADRLTTLTDETSANWTFGYDNADRMTSQSAPNGINTTYEYDGMSRLKRLKHVLGMTSIYDYQYTYNAANQISQIAELAGTKTYTHDNIDRLTAATGESYAFDSVGNRIASHLSSSYTTGAFNRVTATTSATYSYSSNGSMTGKVEGADNWTYAWDRENRMLSATSSRGNAVYQYDALGRRTKRSGSATEKYTFDGLDVLRDDVNGTVSTYQHAPGIDNQLKYTNGTRGARYYLKDHLGSTIGTANSSGGSRDSVTYDSFGNPSSTSYSWRHQYTGRERDVTTGLFYYRARFYDSKLGRFISEDPIGFAGGDVNLYGYVKNKPTSFFDPFGLDEYSMIERFGNQQPSRRTPAEALDELQLRLGVIGMIPGFGEPCDAIDGVISVFRGDYAGAALSGGSMIPFVGWGAGVTKIARRADGVLPRGGVYRLIDPDTGLTMRTGQTNDLGRRRNEHRRDPNLGGFRFEPVYRTDDYSERRGLEQMLYDNSPNAPFNFRNPIGLRNPNRENYKNAAACAPCQKK